MIDMICESEVSLVVNGIQDRGRGPQTSVQPQDLLQSIIGGIL